MRFDWFMAFAMLGSFVVILGGVTGLALLTVWVDQAYGLVPAVIVFFVGLATPIFVLAGMRP